MNGDYSYLGGSVEAYRNERIARGRHLITHRLLSSVQHSKQYDNEEDEFGLASSCSGPSSLVFSRPPELKHSYYHCTFLNQDNLVLCAHRDGIDLIALPSHNVKQVSNKRDPMTRNMGDCVGTLRRNRCLENNQLYPHQGITSLFGGTAFVSGSPNGTYEIYDTEVHASESSTPWCHNPRTRYKRPISALSTVPGPKRHIDNHVGCRSLARNDETLLGFLRGSVGHPSWDFIETGSSSLLSVHIGAERDSFCLHDSRCCRRPGKHSNSSRHTLSIHQDRPHDVFELACFVNERSVATSSIRYQKGDTGAGSSVINLWDTRHGRQPLNAGHSFQWSDGDLHNTSPLSQTNIPMSKNASISHLRALDNKGRLHAVTRLASNRKNRQQGYLHWTVDLATGEARRITTQHMAPACMQTGGHSSPFSLEKSGGVLACASFLEDQKTFDNRVNISFHTTITTTLADRDTRTDMPVSSLHPFCGKRKFPAHFSSTSERSPTPPTDAIQGDRFGQGCDVGKIQPTILDDYGLITPLAHIAWNPYGTRLVGISSNSDLHAWGAYC